MKMDRLLPQHRSWNMSRIKSRDTAPELSVRSALHRLGFRFRKATGEKLPGKPDIVLPKHRTAVFVHGCFWHRHKGCPFAYTPKSRTSFWASKFAGNVKRDARAIRKLRRLGWRVITIWECKTKDADALRSWLASRLLNAPLARHLDQS